MDIYINGKLIHVNPSSSKGKGGEADIFLVNNKAVKIFKAPNHPDFTGNLEEQKIAKERINEHQHKLREFPNNLPSHVIVPEDLVTDKSQIIIGYTMQFIDNSEPLFRYSERSFREAGISNEDVLNIFRDLHKTVLKIHESPAQIGDFNDLNILVSGNEVRIIDSDSFQFGNFFCRMFTPRFTDPLLCDPKASSLILVKPHTSDSDWYSFTVMLTQCLLFVHPYGGVYKPKKPANKIPYDTRPFHHITIFNPEVVYPKPAIHYSVLSDDLLHHLQKVFEQDLRGEFPTKLLENMRWTKCTNCGIEHARPTCPICLQIAPAAIKQVTLVRGKVTSTGVFQTPGLILFSIFQNGKLFWLYHEKDQFKRENGSVIMSGNLDPKIRYRIHNESTLIGKGNTVISLHPAKSPEKIIVDTFGNLPIFDTNGNLRYWLQNGELMCDGEYGPKRIGSVLQGQTLFWVGPSFGFGFYRAGNLSVAFIFNADRPGINDSIKIPLGGGQLIDSSCIFTKEKCYFFISLQERGKTINRCFLINKNGSIQASSQAQQGDGSWLSSIRGKCAVSNFIFAATDDGVVRLEESNQQIIPTKEFPDTEPFIDSGSHIFPGKDGLYVVSMHQISLLKIS
jgi:serine/threonine protein kinase